MAEHSQLSRILLVEDNTPLLRNVAFLLTVAGFDVLTASNGLEAIEILQQQTPDMIISDTDMPQIDGYELLRRVRGKKQWSKIPVIFTSDRYGLQDITRSMDMGVDDYVPKPFDIYDLLYAIKRLLPQHKLNSLKDSA